MFNITKYIKLSMLFILMSVTALHAAPLMSLAEPEILPSPLKSVEGNGEGNITFLMSERNDEDVLGSNRFKVTVTLGKLELKNADISGVKVLDARNSNADVTHEFDVRYLNDPDYVVRIQQKSTETLPGDMRYLVVVPVSVRINTLISSPGNGFAINMSSEGDAIADGTSSAYTYTTICGNGMVESANEACDDGNTISGDGCSNTCTIEQGYVCTAPTCDDTEGPSILNPVCGDGYVVSATEACDDGNTISGDGCSNTCTIEQGYVCTAPTCDDTEGPSVFTIQNTCGDGSVSFANNETCDDGNTISGDGCSNTCTIEQGYVCTAPTCDDTEGPSVFNSVC
ncbi:MAG: myxococcus cysteine-rich repeat containing protein, partial [Campylobacterota bacterium]|nr:myxococcus cysteine-rich repeat containing protein [Campylobacterota bacterium]